MASAHRRHLKYWLAIEIGLPVTFVLLAGLAAQLQDVAYAPLRTLGGLDLVAIAGVILLSVRMEIESDTHRYSIDSVELENYSLAAFMTGIFLLGLYAAVKPYSLKHEVASSATPAFAYVAWSLATTAVCLYAMGATLAYTAKKLLVSFKEQKS